MAVLIGNNYMVWIAVPGETPTYALIAGQQTGSLGATRETIDASHKTSGGVALIIPGLRGYTINLDFVADLPDANGFTVAETAFKAATSVLIELRKGGSTATTSDKIFAGEMYVTSLNPTFGLNGTVSGSITLVPKAAPTTDLTLA